jgi:hypothetical protein
MPIDWSKAAWLTARGAPPREITAAVGCSRSQLRRRQSGCTLFRALVEQYAGEIVRNGGEAALPPPSVRSLEETVRAKLEEEIAAGNTRVALWLAERLRLFAPEAGEGSDAAMQRLLASMNDEEREAFNRPD